MPGIIVFAREVVRTSRSVCLRECVCVSTIPEKIVDDIRGNFPGRSLLKNEDTSNFWEWSRSQPDPGSGLTRTTDHRIRLFEVAFSFGVRYSRAIFIWHFCLSVRLSMHLCPMLIFC